MKISENKYCHFLLLDFPPKIHESPSPKNLLLRNATSEFESPDKTIPEIKIEYPPPPEKISQKTASLSSEHSNIRKIESNRCYWWKLLILSKPSAMVPMTIDTIGAIADSPPKYMDMHTELICIPFTTRDVKHILSRVVGMKDYDYCQPLGAFSPNGIIVKAICIVTMFFARKYYKDTFIPHLQT